MTPDSGNSSRRALGASVATRPAEEGSHVGQLAEVVELVGIDDRPDRLHGAVDDVEDEDVDEAAVRIAHEGAGLTVAAAPLEPPAGRAHSLAETGEEAGDPFGTDDRRAPLRHLAAPVAVDDGIGGEDVDEALDVSVRDGREEAGREPVAVLGRRRETGPLRLDRPAGPER